jgi:hypothetical protein
MPLQNRVDPAGELHAVGVRGTLMGNRGGRFHNDDRTIGARRHVSRRWIACVCDFKNRHRTVWGNGYTELFFLDEVTALSAGHRPCFECRRTDALAFQKRLPFAPDEAPGADAMDAHLDAERRDIRRKRTHTIDLEIAPDGVCFLLGASIYALRAGKAFTWTHEGYKPSLLPAPPPHVQALTPPAIIEVLRRGYQPRWHASADRLTPPQR